MSLIYKDPSVSHDEAITLLASGVSTKVIVGLISIGLNETDRIWAENICLQYLANEDEAVAASAIKALGHIARRHSELDKETVLAALEALKKKFPSLEGVIADTLDDIEIFT
ncbi:hypothetical protein EJA72_21500 [Pseudomonas sp. PB120]|uniref:hypothetical protein n=1 Tax=Pseudomonas sp. PB120 TaxID=2494700 RepID=UPI001320A53C|nr:hypothetical protein [Pseudomonas sp. PB120]